MIAGHEEFEQLVGVWRVTEYRNAEIFKVKYVEDRWVPLNSSAPEGFTYSSPDSQVFPMRKKAG